MFSSGTREVKIWDLETGQELLTLRATGSLLSHVEFADDGNTLLAGRRGGIGTWQIWRAPTWADIEKTERAGASYLRSKDR